MKRTLLILVIACGLALADRAEAKGRSYSSGGSSFGGRSLPSFGGSSGSRPGGRSYSSGGSSGVKIVVPWSSPSGSKGVTLPNFSKPAPSFSGGGASSAKPVGKSFDSGAAAAQRKQESKTAFDARSVPTSPGSHAAPSGGIAPEGRSYSAGPAVLAGKPAGRNYSLNRTGRGESYDANAAAAQRRQESKAAYTQGKPRTEYTTPQGQSRPLDSQNRVVEQLRRQIDLSQWSMRQERRRQIIVPAAPAAPVVVYHDPFSNWFWFWLLTQNLNTRASWAYNYRRDMDDARYRELLARDKQLEAHIHELEAKGAPPDPTYVPPGLDYDLMFDDGFVDAAVNPQPAPQEEVSRVPSDQVKAAPSAARSVPGALWRILLIVAGMAFLVWLVFIKRWGGT